MSEHVINHCGQREAIEQAGLDRAGFMEAVMERTGVLVREAQTGGTPVGSKQKSALVKSEPHALAGIELTAHVVAEAVLRAGAAKLCADFEVNLDTLIEHASSTHISSC